jgi:predicted nucleotidyltransferase
MPADPALVKTLRAALADRQDVELALLFGSRARGRFRPDSDVDVAYLGKEVDPLELGAHLTSATRLEVQAVDIHRASYPLLMALLRDGIVLHEGKRGTAGRWRARAITETELDRPGFERMREALFDRLARRAQAREAHG